MYGLLQRFIESEHFNNDPSLAVAYLSRYASHVGIQYVLCSKLRSFAYEEIEFFLPQLCHLLVSVENESMALEEFIIDLCQESVSGALLVSPPVETDGCSHEGLPVDKRPAQTFWLFQTHLHDLASTPHTHSFEVCRRVFNKVQHIVFGTWEPIQSEKIHENVLPTTILASIILSGVAAPFFPQHLGPLAIAQARKPRSPDETISEPPPLQKLSRSHTVSALSQRSSTPRSSQRPHQAVSPTQPEPKGKTSKTSAKIRTGHTRASSKSQPRTRHASANIDSEVNRLSSASLPDFMLEAKSSEVPQRPHYKNLRRHSHGPQPASERDSSYSERMHILRSHYFRSETQFLTALEGISNRLVILPKAARLSALRAELALIARDLPAEVDIPLLCPATLEDGAPSRSKHHRVMRLNPAEATSLNSAERVPYLLMVEVLRDDFDFDPDSESNQQLLATLKQGGLKASPRLFDLNAAKSSVQFDANDNVETAFEPANGDLSSPTLLKDFSHGDLLIAEQSVAAASPTLMHRSSPMSPAAFGTADESQSRNAPVDPLVPMSRSHSPALRKVTGVNKDRNPDPPNLSALATHMRTAAQMLAQLDVSGAKRPRHEVESIKAKIIASMQDLEEENFNVDGNTPDTTLDHIMSTVSAPHAASDNSHRGIQSDPDPQSGTFDSEAGAARMENDQKTGGVRRKGDRDDPSAAMFGEDWVSKRERIRKSSPYGWMKNWDLLSLIVKTGSDLRQELFACQLIRICSKIFEDAKVPVWVKKMRILVTGESSGLIETITNGVSLHSLKRSLTLASIASGTNSRKRFATLKDHFIKTFGEVESPGYRAGEEAFVQSLAAYSILSYVLQLKDRHNGNILIDNQGHIIHIDFGFMLSNSPGSVGFEAAPFKLTQEYVEVLGGTDSPAFERYKSLCKQAFQALRKSAENIVSVVEMMGKESKMACFTSGSIQTTNGLRQRFMLHLSREEAEVYVDNELIGKSLGSYFTRL
ncbi:MAG: Phosphatidylinositol 4-kinase pik1alpha (PI4-kinase)(PtdIns-4-kinase) [Chrysothrix sp. TS-e1954]|nr:MAG: Phosphatidylinositol 4-kinase pik1alpha (PI4-kinase)(PtdIns-4-kinase) [Chrysothrix sp. TS-e1954]